MELSFRSLTVMSDTQVALTFEDERGQAVTYRFETTETGLAGITVTNGEDAFDSLYRRVRVRHSRCGQSGSRRRPWRHARNRCPQARILNG